MTSEKPGQGTFISRAHSGRIARKLIAGIVIVLMIGGLVAIPWEVGQQTEMIYRDQVAQLQGRGFDARVTSYQRGWYHSTATVDANYQGHHLKFTSDISHGPFIFSGESAS
ncbi:MAG TPA: DUF945 family protein, partial [Candidatus Binataceae bacterium]|nr:DUF945 family protein [Candidatus Binataceae bacterium]